MHNANNSLLYLLIWLKLKIFFVFWISYLNQEGYKIILQNIIIVL